MLPPLAEVHELEARVGQTLDDPDRAEAALGDASAMVRAEAGVLWVDEQGLLEDVPDVAKAVVLAAARRAYLNPEGIRQESVDGYSYSLSGATGVYLSRDERRMVRRAAGRGGAFTIDMVNQDYVTVQDVWL